MESFNFYQFLRENCVLFKFFSITFLSIFGSFSEVKKIQDKYEKSEKSWQTLQLYRHIIVYIIFATSDLPTGNDNCDEYLDDPNHPLTTVSN